VYIHSRLPEQFSGSQAGFGTTFRDKGSFQKAGTSSLKRVTGRNFTISDFIEATETSLWLSFTKRQLKNVKNISAHSKSTVRFLIFEPSKKLFIS
jgi:hypothetical protein